MNNIKKIFLISDTHFGHQNMIEYCGRPVSFEDRLWAGLEQIDANDILIHLGDICIGKDAEVHQKISKYKFKKILVKGNHDHKNNNWYTSHGWDFVCDNFMWTLHEKNIIFSHKPMKINDDKNTINIHGHLHNALPKLLKNSFKWIGIEKPDHYNIDMITDRHKLIACELLDYKPILLEKAINL